MVMDLILHDLLEPAPPFLLNFLSTMTYIMSI
jgi:hypothetical protein